MVMERAPARATVPPSPGGGRDGAAATGPDGNAGAMSSLGQAHTLRQDAACDTWGQEMLTCCHVT